MATTTLERRPDTMFGRLSDWLDMPDLFRAFDKKLGDMIRVEETVKDDHLMIKAELPGIDPDKDVEITLTDGLLTIAAERREEDKGDKEGSTFSEFRYGSFRRTLRVPKDAKATDVKASYKDGVLSITVPVPKATAPVAAKITVKRS